MTELRPRPSYGHALAASALLDLGQMVPAATAAGVAVLRGSWRTVPAAHAVVGWFALVPPSGAAMALVMLGP